VAADCAQTIDDDCEASMTRPGFLSNPSVRHWLGDIEPAWTVLTDESFSALAAEPSVANTALRVANDLTAAELDTSAVARNTLVLLHHAAQDVGLKLTQMAILPVQLLPN
jgi:hypothetical protein